MTALLQVCDSKMPESGMIEGIGYGTAYGWLSWHFHQVEPVTPRDEPRDALHQAVKYGVGIVRGTYYSAWVTYDATRWPASRFTVRFDQRLTVLPY